MIERRKVLGGTAAAAAAGSRSRPRPCPKPAIAQSQPEIKWRLTSSFPKSLDTIYGAAEVFAKAVAEMTDNRFQIQVFAVRRDRARPAGGGRRDQRHRRDAATPPPTTMSARTRPSPSARRCRSASTAGMQDAWLFEGGGNELMNEFYAKYNIHALPCGNTGCQMGGWFRKEIKTVADLNGLKMRIGGFAGQVLQQARRGAAADRRRRHLSGAGEGHDRRRRVGRPLRRREARLLQGRAILLLSRAGGKAGRRCTSSSTRRNGTSCRRTTRRSLVNAAPPRQHLHAGALRPR